MCYLLRNNLGSGHGGAVRTRHCQTKATLNLVTYRPGRFLLLLVFFFLRRLCDLFSARLWLSVRPPSRDFSLQFQRVLNHSYKSFIDC